MPFFIQYDEVGNITATVSTEAAPASELQITFDEWQDTTNKMIDLNTLELIDMPMVENQE